MTVLREKRLNAGVSMTALARSAGVSYANLCRYERGWAVPTQQTGRRIAEALGVSLGELFPGQPLKDLGGAA